MSTKYEFDNGTIESFCNTNGVTIELTVNQLNRLVSEGKTPLLVEQLTNVVDQLCPDEENLRKFIEQKSVEFNPIALSLYILNDDLWKIMARKQDYTEKMLPMTTIPWFYWEKDAESRENPSGVRKLDDLKHPFTVMFEKGFLIIQGKGGDFAGLLEGRIVDQHKGIRPIIIPGSIGPTKIVARYESQLLRIKLDIQSSKANLYPHPMKELDYVFSENPRVFYDHGIQIEIDGEDVSGKVGNRRENTLRGKVILLIGKDFNETTDSSSILMFHVWLAMMNRIPFL